MRDTQDELFDSEYWASAVRSAARNSVSTPLGVAVVYDSRVHGSWRLIRRKVNDVLGTVADVGNNRSKVRLIPGDLEEPAWDRSSLPART